MNIHCKHRKAGDLRRCKKCYGAHSFSFPIHSLQWEAVLGEPSKRRDSFKRIAAEIGRLTDEKKKQYGDSAKRAGEIMAVLYPDGIPVEAFGSALLVVRICDKLCRIATQATAGVDGGGEDAWKDIAGYGLIGSQAKR